MKLQRLLPEEIFKKLAIVGNDEVAELASSFNYMAEELNKLEELRRGFIANISHDLRSPLTSIKGFVQAILMELFRRKTNKVS